MTLASILGILSTQLPLYIVWLVGIVLAITRWQRHPRTSLFALLGLGIVLILGVVGPVLSTWLPFLLHQGTEAGPRVIGLAGGVLSLVRGLLGAGAWVLLLIAIFGPRE